MPWTVTDDVSEFARVAGPMLARRPDENTVALTLIESLLAANSTPSSGAMFGWFANGSGDPAEPGAVGGTMLRTPPFPLLLSELGDAAEESLLDALPEQGREIPALSGEVGSVERVAARWCALHGGSSSLDMSQHLYRLGQLVQPSVPGSARLAGASDLDLVVAWFEAFVEEAEGNHAGADLIRARVSDELVWLWVDGSATPVSMAGRNRIAVGVSRVGPVYTPVEHRRHGYGAAVTAACSQAALAAGAEAVVLFTDASNPTSNAIYQQLGFRLQSDRLVMSLRPAS